MTKQDVLEMFWNEPIKVGHWCGFKDLGELHNEWLKSFLYEDKDQTLQAHRGSYKTTDLALFFAENLIIRPNETMMLFRKTSGDVAEVMRTVSNILRSPCVSTIVKVLYGKDIMLLTDTYSAVSTNLTTSIKGQAQLVGMGIGTSITGKHADIVVTDDIVNISDRISKAERERTKIAYQELQNIKNRGGRFINTGTPWHKDDCFELMPNIRKFTCYDTKMISEEKLQELRDSMLPSLFAANYELKHIAGEDVIFTNPNIGGDIAMIEQGVAHVDAAFYGEDYTAFTICKRHGDKYYVFGKCWRKHVEDCYNQIKELFDKHMCGKLHIERNADKGLVARDLKNIGIRVNAYNESENKYIKIVTRLKKVWKDVIFVDGTDEEYIEQICDFNEDAPHDDCPDSLASLIRILYNKKDDYVPLWN